MGDIDSDALPADDALRAEDALRAADALRAEDALPAADAVPRADAPADDDGVPPADAARMTALPSLASLTHVTVLSGGITNRNYRATLADGRVVVVRLSDPDTSDLAIDREHEHANSRAAALAGAAPAVVDYLPGAGALVIAWVPGRTLTDTDLADAQTLRRAAAACRRLHAGPDFGNRFDMFDIQERYRRLVGERGYRLPDGYDEFAPHVRALRRAMARHTEPLVPCNNDLLSANFIDDGDRLWLIDYEYSGMNEASFELGNIWSEATLDEELLDVLVGAYWGGPSPAKRARSRAWALMSQYGWTLWASIQAGQSTIDFDYWSWGMEKYDRAVSFFDSPRFEALLTEV